MKQFSLVLLLSTILLQDIPALPVNQILQQRSKKTDDGYEFAYLAEDGSRRQEIGRFVYRANETEPVLHVKGMYSYFDGQGREFVVNYVADHEGTKVQEYTLPPLPPLPPRKNETEPGTTTETELPSLEISSAALAALAGGGLGK